ncbi:MAG: acetolactate synthase AlsS [Liquorilactobacillus nagelii]|jgi:acetolactate synthase-1/2/3 large subunit|uniref:Acetolactate synthase large subunit n=1 Tax=Liquorilactobacillus nagelii TaxID=82688 RepID=A0A3S6QT52_9LACO|nr:acetolactate synthase AlsS [Liquorilactobacillus nagelii]AUJ31296.1 acetolactate synthase large subunit [Liquorilactobacillus nagelii]KRL40332.1 acetolactate synthase [Liquorilactobacillus nagelii DSM 13675]MCI1699241.1 acetolactate synthase AlsS [Liquorilactobacillus nagelii]MCP9315050.1 acetolactate synthase AlsS [Liquorilactobacillus nagelii]QYH54773.1 acetolactate synthase AlsS [Liquorilactobacillus nagelii DSM 13675]
MKDEKKYYGADAIVDSLINHDVKYVFGIPGAKVDRVFERLDHPTNSKSPKLILTRHEQNAAFMAAGIGRITGKPGVALTTSGPGASNLATGLVTATAEGDPVLAISGQVQRTDLLRQTHQSMANSSLFAPITKFSAEVQDPENISEVIANAYQEAEAGKQGAGFVSVPQDVTDAQVHTKVIKPLAAPKLGPASPIESTLLAQRIKAAQLPVLLLGMRASSPETTKAIRNLIAETHLPVVETFQGAGIIPREMEDDFFGRVGLFRNQPGDLLLKKSDLVVAIGYDPIEYEPRNWNADGKANIVVIDSMRAEIDKNFQPERELIGDIAQTLDFLLPYMKGYQIPEGSKEYLDQMHEKFEERDAAPAIKKDQVLNHPLSIIQELQQRITDEMTVTVDVGSFYIWMARHFRSYAPRHLLFSNGMQTLGVALPWAIAAALVRPNTQIVSVSGDGGFLFSAQDLETAVRLNLNIVHIIWNDGNYDMVKFQEELKYGSPAGVKFGPVDFVKYAESFGATGYRVGQATDLGKVLDQAFATKGPVIVDIPVDYSFNQELGKQILDDQLH